MPIYYMCKMCEKCPEDEIRSIHSFSLDRLVAYSSMISNYTNMYFRNFKKPFQSILKKLNDDQCLHAQFKKNYPKCSVSLYLNCMNNEGNKPYPNKHE